MDHARFGRTRVALLLLGLLACEGTTSGDDAAAPDGAADAVTVPDAATLDASADLPSVDVPPPDAPRADVPTTDVQPGDVPPGDAPPTEVIDEHCGGPSFPDQCVDVSEFQCGFQATCAAGTVTAAWHVHVFCSDDDPIEDIVDFTCSVACPNGCQEGVSYDWPQSGAQFVEMFCDPCDEPADCDALGLPHDDCVGGWACDGGQCGWACTSACAGEGDSVPVVPGAPPCCEGLGKVPCDAPDADGVCQGCDGASVCVACGDGQCGAGENPCNCPDDCAEDPVDLCALAGGTCSVSCPDGDVIVADAGCPVDSQCCVKHTGCLGLGAGFLDFDTTGKCCEGFVPASDCDPMEDGACSCPKCPCYLCLPCGDGTCGPFENACNCPADCSGAAQKVPSVQSECQGSAAAWQPVADDGAGISTFSVEGSTLKLLHEGLAQNCCAVLEVWSLVDAAHHTLRLEERLAQPYEPCWCTCFFTLTAEVADLAAGTWTVTLYNEELDYDLMVQEITIP